MKYSVDSNNGAHTQAAFIGRSFHSRRIVLPLALCLVLTACGGGGSDGDTTPPSTSTLELSGSVAVGLPLVGSQVIAKCVAGSGTSATDTAGSYAISIVNGIGPCLVQASGGTVGVSGSTNADTLVGAANQSGKANVTPLTHLILSQALQQDPVAAFNGSIPATQLTSSKLATAWTSVKTALQGFGVDVTTVDQDPLSAPFTPGSATDPMDLSLEALKARLDALDGTLTSLILALINGSTKLADAICPTTQQTANYTGPSCWQHINQYDPTVGIVKVANGQTSLAGTPVTLTRKSDRIMRVSGFPTSYTADEKIVEICLNESPTGPQVAKHLLLGPDVAPRRDAAILENLKGHVFNLLENCELSSGKPGPSRSASIARMTFNDDGTATFLDQPAGDAASPSIFSAAQLRGWLVDGKPLSGDDPWQTHFAAYEYKASDGTPVYAISMIQTPDEGVTTGTNPELVGVGILIEDE